MFTGLIESVCRVTSVQSGYGTMKIGIDIGDLAAKVKIGDSIAVNGACLTVTAIEGKTAYFDVSGETISKTTVGSLKTSSMVNIERAMAADARFGGHFVLGHVDGIGKIENIERRDNFATLRFSAATEILEQLIAKGSVAIDGISLTIARVDDKGFEAAIIPQTLANTTLANFNRGDTVNVETDIIVKAINKQLERILPAKEGLTIDKLKDMGF